MNSSIARIETSASIPALFILAHAVRCAEASQEKRGFFGRFWNWFKGLFYSGKANMPQEPQHQSSNYPDQVSPVSSTTAQSSNPSAKENKLYVTWNDLKMEGKELESSRSLVESLKQFLEEVERFLQDLHNHKFSEAYNKLSQEEQTRIEGICRDATMMRERACLQCAYVENRTTLDNILENMSSDSNLFQKEDKCLEYCEHLMKCMRTFEDLSNCARNIGLREDTPLVMAICEELKFATEAYAKADSQVQKLRQERTKRASTNGDDNSTRHQD